jgi:hypothetical protein
VLEDLLATKTTGADEVLASYDWEKSAGILKEALLKIEAKDAG